MDCTGLRNENGINVENKKRTGQGFPARSKGYIMNDTKITEEDNLRRIAESTTFSYREVWVMSLFVREDMLEEALECVTMFGTSVGEYLSSVGAAPERVIHDLLNPEES